MGAYLDTPVTAKQSSHGTCRVGSREVSYASSAMQGWRFSMEDAHVVVPDYDDSTALLAVFDGHGGKEVAEYCARHMPEMLQSNACYKSGDLPTALRELFMTTDRRLQEKEAIREMKGYETGKKEGDEDMEVDSSDEREEARKLLEEANMPLDTLLAQYVAGSEGEGEDEDGDSAEPGGSGRLRTVLEALASQAGFEIEFDDSSDSDDSEYNDEDDEGDVAVEGEGEGGREGKEEEIEGEVKGKEGEGEGERERGGETDEKKEEIGDEGRERERENGKEGEREGDGEEENEEEKKISEELETKEKRINNNSTTIEVNSEENNTEYDERQLTTHSGDSQTTAVTIDHSPSIDTCPETPSLQGSKGTLNSCSVDISCVEDSIETGLAGRETGLTGRESSFTGRETGLTGREAGLTSRKQVTPPQLKSTSADASLCDDKQEGLDRDGKPLECTTESCNSSTRVDNTSTRAKNSSTRACGSGENDKQSSRGRSLLDLLTSSTALDSMPPPSSKGAHGSRKRSREDSSNGDRKHFCRGILDEEGYHSGTTAVVCLLRENTLTVANAGDSRCVLSCRGIAVDMSEDHKPTDQAELCRIERAGGCVGADGRVNGGLNLSRAIGDHFYKENPSLSLEEQMITAVPDVKSRQLQNDDEFVVVACDGIWNTMSSQEVVDFVRDDYRLSGRLSEGGERSTVSASLLEGICESLCDACIASDTDNDGTGCDNMTVAIALLKPTSHFLSYSPLPLEGSNT